jgi:hypothetical protein
MPNAQQPRLTVVPETHQQGHLSIENLDLIKSSDLHNCDVGIQTSPDGRIWLCVNGIAFIRFKPARL